MKSTGRVVFVTRGGAQTGLGHVKRCLALATAFANEGADVDFIVSPDTKTAAFIRAAGFLVLQKTWEHRPAALCDAVGDPRAATVIVDAYTARTEHFEALRPCVTQLVAIDDTAERRLPVDVVVNGGAGTENLAYDVPTGTRLLLGSRYALLDPAFATPPARSVHQRVERVLVTLGGSVHADALQKTLIAVDAALDKVQIDVLPGPFGSVGAMDGTAIKRNRIIDYGSLPELRPLMLEADLAVTGAGMTLYELAATATPVVSVTMAPNQRPNAAAFERAGAALAAGSADHPDLCATVARHLGRLAADAALREKLGAVGRRLVDGQGASRVARELTSVPSPRK